MRYAMINVKSNVVENIVELTATWPEDKSWECPQGHFMIDSDTVAIGDTYDYDTQSFIRPAAAE